MNLEDFSVVRSMLGAFENSNELSQGITPIKLEKADGSVIKLGKTRREKQEELQLENELEMARKDVKLKKGRKSSLSQNGVDLNEEINL